MKVGILTYHRVVNKGSVMQAFCLQSILQDQFPDDTIEIIDYRPWLVEKREYRKLLSSQPPFFSRAQIGKFRAVRGFLNEYCTVSSDRCISDRTAKARDFIKSQDYDVIVVGSDTVWCVREDGGAPLAPNIYTLPRVDTPQKIAFAASADQTKDRLLDDDMRRKRIREGIEDFDYISVRDERTMRVLGRIGINESSIHSMPDPTILWDFSSIVERPKLPFEGKKVAAVEIGSQQIKRRVTSLLKSQGYTVVNLLGRAMANQEKIPSDLSVPERLGVYDCFDLLITDRFHGTIFTLRTSNTPFIFVESTETYPEPFSKGRDLLRELNLEELVWRTTDGNLTESDLHSYLQIWEDRSGVLPESLKQLQKHGRKEVTRIMEKLTNEL